MKNTDKHTDELFQIASRASYAVHERGSLETRHSDSEDFLQVPVWALRQMLREAYELGRENR